MTTKYYDFEVGFSLRSDESDERFEEFIDCVIDELTNLGREVDVTGSLTKHVVHFVLTTEDLREDSAVSAMVALRTALHAAHCATPNWPAVSEIFGMNRVDTRALAAV